MPRKKISETKTSVWIVPSFKQKKNYSDKWNEIIPNPKLFELCIYDIDSEENWTNVI